MSVLFFFQAEDGIRDDLVTGVQTCALPISRTAVAAGTAPAQRGVAAPARDRPAGGRAARSSLSVPDAGPRCLARDRLWRWRAPRRTGRASPGDWFYRLRGVRGRHRAAARRGRAA